MKITLLTIGSHGDVRPYLALAIGLKAAGFTVTLATHEEFRDFITGHGIDFYPVKGNPKAVFESETGQALLSSGTRFLEFIRLFRQAAEADMLGGFDDCLAASQGADAIICPFFVAGVAYQISRVVGCKTILAYLQPTTPTAAFPVLMLPNLYLGGFLNRLSHQVVRLLFWQVFRDTVETWTRESLSISKPPRLGPVARLEKQSLVLLGYSKYLVPRPRDWPSNFQVTGFWQLNEAKHYQPPADLAEFLAAGAAPVYLGFGSMHSQEPEAVADLILQALQLTGQRGLLMSGWGGLSAAALPESVHLLESVPHDWLFPRMQGVVHHGGAGTTGTGLMAGVPNLLIPFFGDQPFWAQRVFGMRAGPRPIPRQKLSVDKLSQGLQALSRYQQSAAELGAKMRSEGGVAEAVYLIKKYMGVL